MSSRTLKLSAALSFSRSVRRTALAAGTLSALLSGGLPLTGVEPGVVMGRVVLLPPVLALALHLALALLYAPLLSFVLCRSRDWWTVLGAGTATLTLYAANRACALWPPVLSSEADVLLAHVIFGGVFTLFFKLAEIGAEDPAPFTPRT